MSDPSFTRKIYIDARQATPSSRSTSDFEVVLGRDVVLPPKAAGFVTDIHIPHSWYTVDDGSQYLYARINASGTEFGIRVQLSKGNYTGEASWHEMPDPSTWWARSSGATTTGSGVLIESSQDLVKDDADLDTALLARHDARGWAA